MAKRRLPLLARQIVVGRAPECTVAIQDHSVSRRHLLLLRTQDGWRARDLGSGNGTLLNERPLSQDALLARGDVLTLGATVLRFDEAPRTGPVPIPSPRTPLPPPPPLTRKPFWIIGAVTLGFAAAMVGGRELQLALREQVAGEAAEATERNARVEARLQEALRIARDGDAVRAQSLARLLALDLERRGAQQSPPGRPLGPPAAEALLRAAERARAGGLWSLAGEYARLALRAEPGHAGARRLLAELQVKAEELFLLAYSMKDQDRAQARAKLEEVIAMTSPDDPNHAKARSWAEKLK